MTIAAARARDLSRGGAKTRSARARLRRTATAAARLIATAMLIAPSACRVPDAPPAGADAALRALDEAPLERVATSREGMVVSGSAPATRAGASVLAAGGNAVDAAVATALALAVTEPTQSGLGGRTQALVRRPDGRTFAVDATTAVPAAYDPDQAEQADDGYAVVGIPGTVAGLASVHARAGSRPWSEVVDPALRLAEAGFIVSEGEAARLAGIADRLAVFPGAREAFLRPDGSSYQAGDTLVQLDLARVLRTLRDDGPEAFYRGSIAEAIAADVGERGHVTAADLAAYRAEPSIVVEGAFAGLALVGSYLPASGATTIEALQILDRLELVELQAEERSFAIGQALLASFEDREAALADERPAAADAERITSSALADARARVIRERMTLMREARAAPQTAERPPGARAAGPERVAQRVRLAPPEHRESEHTTHLSVVDRTGMAVAMTQSLGPTGGSRVATPGLGFLYAATLGGYLGRVEPADRPWSSQSPLVVLRDGWPAYVMGGAGSRRIISALVQTLVRSEVEGLAMEAALAATRFHPTASAWTFEQAHPDDSLPAGARTARAAGHEIRIRPFDVFFARLNVVELERAGGGARMVGAAVSMVGLADPRWEWGAASGPPEGQPPSRR